MELPVERNSKCRACTQGQYPWYFYALFTHYVNLYHAFSPKLYIRVGLNDAIFSAPVQTGPGAHAAFCTMGTGCLFLG